MTRWRKKAAVIALLVGASAMLLACEGGKRLCREPGYTCSDDEDKEE